ncbi:MAG TPA: hypothetical protein VHZ74_11925 [Bryobacteraceae bacterium]|nr:hypothetical protein [Bryobacteraceae bacterium]
MRNVQTSPRGKPRDVAGPHVHGIYDAVVAADEDAAKAIPGCEYILEPHAALFPPFQPDHDPTLTSPGAGLDAQRFVMMHANAGRNSW